MLTLLLQVLLLSKVMFLQEVLLLQVRLLLQALLLQVLLLRLLLLQVLLQHAQALVLSCGLVHVGRRVAVAAYPDGRKGGERGQR